MSHDLRRKIDEFKDIPLKSNGQIDLTAMRRMVWKNQQVILSEVSHQSKTDGELKTQADRIEKKAILGVIAFGGVILLSGIAVTQHFGLSYGALASVSVFILKYIIGGIKSFIA